MANTKSPIVIDCIGRRLCSIDFRSLAAFRIGVGFLILFDLWNRSSALKWHYTDQGIVPLALCHWGWSFHALNGAWQFEAALFLLAACAAVALLLGFRTWSATVITWLLCVSLQNRNILITNSGDMLLALLLFWAMFLPLGNRYSLDQVGRRNSPDRPDSHYSPATVAILAQLGLMYFFSGLFKLNAVWLDGTAMQNALNLDLLARPFAYEALKYPRVLEVVSRTTPWLELALPVLCFVPWATGTIRCAVIVIAALFHLGVELTLATGLFPYVCMLGWTLFLPSSFWNRIGYLFDSEARSTTKAPVTANRGEYYQNLEHLDLPAVYNDENGLLPVSPSMRSSLESEKCSLEGSALLPKRSSLEVFRATLIFSLLGYVILSNIDEWSWEVKAVRVIPHPLRQIGGILRLTQKWNMFEKPEPMHGWYVVTGTLADGRKADLLTGAIDPVDLRYTKPFRVADQFPNHRWRKFFANLVLLETDVKYVQSLARSFCHDWNSAHEPPATIQRVEIEFLREAENTGIPHRVLERSLYHIEDCRTSDKPAGDE